MPTTLNLPDLRNILKGLDRRIGVLERRTRPATPVADESSSIIFSLPGAFSVSTSPPIRIWKGGSLKVLAVTLGTAGSTSTVLDVQRNGSTVATVTVPASTTSYNGDVSARFDADSDTLTIAVTTVGTGAADMTAEARFT